MRPNSLNWRVQSPRRIVYSQLVWRVYRHHNLKGEISVWKIFSADEHLLAERFTSTDFLGTDGIYFFFSCLFSVR